MSDKKTAIVTGASRGIGLAITRDLVNRGWKVAMTARTEKALIDAAAQFDSGSVLPVTCDVTDAGAVADAITQVEQGLGPVSALVNNAGVIDPIGKFLDTDPEEWMQLQSINLGGVMRMTRAVLPAMLARGSGTIVNLSTGAALNPMEGWSAYCTSKAALAMFTRCMATEYGPLGIRVHDFIPGVVNTDMLNGAQKKYDNAVAKLDDSVKLPPDVPASCIAWLVDKGDGRATGVQQSIRDPELRKMVGLKERAQW